MHVMLLISTFYVMYHCLNIPTSVCFQQHTLLADVLIMGAGKFGPTCKHVAVNYSCCATSNTLRCVILHFQVYSVAAAALRDCASNC